MRCEVIIGFLWHIPPATGNRARRARYWPSESTAFRGPAEAVRVASSAVCSPPDNPACRLLSPPLDAPPCHASSRANDQCRRRPFRHRIDQGASGRAERTSASSLCCARSDRAGIVLRLFFKPAESPYASRRTCAYGLAAVPVLGLAPPGSRWFDRRRMPGHTKLSWLFSKRLQ